MAELVVDNIAKSYPTSGEPLVVLRGVSFSLDRGQSLAIVGPSGCGKSTLLHVIGTLDQPTAGSIRLSNVDPFSLSEVALAQFRNQNVGFIFQESFLLPQLSVLENVLVPALAIGAPTNEDQDRACELLKRVGLEGRQSHLPSELSGGERQRVAVARALLKKPQLILADEPTGSLDRTNALKVGEILKELQKEESAMLVVVTHSHDLANLLDRREELDEGRFRTESNATV